MALTAGGFALLIVMPLAGFATGKVSARYAHGDRLQHVRAYLPLSRQMVTTLDMTFPAASWLRVVQMLPLPFCFISITTAAYVGMPKEQSNQVAGLINFARNIGGSILIAITNAQVTNRARMAPAALAGGHAAWFHAFQQQSQALSRILWRAISAPNGVGLALANLYSQLNRQAQMQGYQDVYMELSWMSMGLVVLAFLLSKNRPGAGARVVGDALKAEPPQSASNSLEIFTNDALPMRIPRWPFPSIRPIIRARKPLSRKDAHTRHLF